VRSTSAVSVKTYQSFVNQYMNSIKLDDGKQQFLAYVAPVTTNNIDNYFYHPLHHLNKYFKAFNMMSMKYIVMKKSSADPAMLSHYANLFSKLNLVYQDQDVAIYLNPTALPRVFSVSNLVLTDSFENAQIKSVESAIDLRNTAIVENKLPINWENQSGKIKTVEQILEYQPNKVKIDFKSDHNAFLVLTDVFYPGWTATIDGKPTDIYRVDGLFRGVVVPAGEHVVEYHYFPVIFQISLILSALAALICVFSFF
jgi:hypothetical protein